MKLLKTNKMKKYILVFATFLICNHVWAQPTFTWAKKMGGISGDFGSSIALDASGNVFTTGFFQGTADFDPGAGTFNLTSQGYRDIFISKLDAAGNFVWAKKMGGTSSNDEGFSIALDGSGNVYTTGFFEGTADFNPGAGVANLTSQGYRDIFISKLDAAGNFVWAKKMGGTDLDEGYSIALDGSGNVYTTGYFEETVDFNPGAGVANLTSAGNADIFISKLDAAGNFVWAKQMGGTSVSGDIGRSIALDGSGNVYTTGSFHGTADFDPGAGTFNLTSQGHRDIFISKLDAAGNFVWAKKMGGTSSYDEGYSIALDASGNVFTTGIFQGVADFDPGAGTFNLTSAGSYDIFISKLDAAGNFVWAKQMGGIFGEESFSIALDGSGNVFTTGYFDNIVDFDPGAGTFNLTSVGSTDIFISKLDAAGNFVWAKQMGGTMDDRGQSIALDASGNVYTTGYFNGTADFDPGAGTFNLTSAGSYDIFVHKMADCLAPPATPGAISGNTTICSGSTNTYSITAVSGATSYNWTLPGGWTGTSTTNSIITTASATSGNITVTATNTCGTSAASSQAITVNTIPATPGTISGTTTICSGSSNTYSITAVAGATSYTWTLPGGWTGTSTTNSIITTASATSGNISVTATNACGTSAASSTTTVTVNALPVVSLGPNIIQCGGTAMLDAGNTGSIYLWSDLSTSQTLTVSTSGTYIVVVTNVNGCMGSDSAVVTINSNPTVTASASSVVVCVDDASVTLLGIPTGGVWSGPGVSGSNFNPSIAGVGAQTASYSYTDANGCSNIATVNVQVNACVGFVENILANGVSVYPNPNNGSFTLSVNANVADLTIKITDMQGRVVYASVENNVNAGFVKQISLDTQSSGMYLMHIIANGEQRTEKIAVQK